MARIIVPVNYTLYRNGVPIASGIMNGSTQLSYTPPDASPATYVIQFAATPANNSSTNTIGQRAMAMVGYRR